ncbi:hypothetical protein FKM82_009958 [Ascaphus truei]
MSLCFGGEGRLAEQGWYKYRIPCSWHMLVAKELRQTVAQNDGTAVAALPVSWSHGKLITFPWLWGGGELSELRLYFSLMIH